MHELTKLLTSRLLTSNRASHPQLAAPVSTPQRIYQVSRNPKVMTKLLQSPRSLQPSPPLSGAPPSKGVTKNSSSARQKSATSASKQNSICIQPNTVSRTFSTRKNLEGSDESVEVQ